MPDTRAVGAAASIVALATWSGCCCADFDHRVERDEHGIWSRSAQNVVYYGAIVTELGGALWLGGDDKLGRTLWESVDASVFSAVTAEVAKRAFGRRRPSQTPDPTDWFNHGSCCRSFPSGEVTLQASFVTPLIVNYASDRPWVWALEALPAYDAVPRVKSRRTGRPTCSPDGRSEARSATGRPGAIRRCSCK
jgi:undecaprenyl-diphosphatase